MLQVIRNNQGRAGRVRSGEPWHAEDFLVRRFIKNCIPGSIHKLDIGFRGLPFANDVELCLWNNVNLSSGFNGTLDYVATHNGAQVAGSVASSVEPAAKTAGNRLDEKMSV